MADKNDAEKAAKQAEDDFGAYCRTAKREVITLSPEAFDELVKLLNAPPTPNERLRALANRKPTSDSNDDGVLHLIYAPKTPL
jgi:hypothetical protein